MKKKTKTKTKTNWLTAAVNAMNKKFSLNLDEDTTEAELEHVILSIESKKAEKPKMTEEESTKILLTEKLKPIKNRLQILKADLAKMQKEFQTLQKEFQARKKENSALKNAVMALKFPNLNGKKKTFDGNTQIGLGSLKNLHN